MDVAVPIVSKVSFKPSPTEVDLLQGEIATLKQEIKTLQARGTQAVCHRSPSPSHHSPVNHSSTICWYH